jgi:hypothetical protein
MPLSYVAVTWGGLSKRALLRWAPSAAPRSQGSKLDTVGRHDGAMPHPIGARRLPDDLLEGSAKCPEAAEAYVEADLGHGVVTLAQQKMLPIDPPPMQVAVGRLAEYAAEAATDVGGRNVGHRGHCAHVERRGVGAVHRVTGTQQAPIEFFGFTAHPPRLGETTRTLGPHKRPRDTVALLADHKHVQKGCPPPHDLGAQAPVSANGMPGQLPLGSEQHWTGCTRTARGLARRRRR